MIRRVKKYSSRLFPTVLILFILEAMTLPLVVSLTWSGRSESPEHTLTYTQFRLTWDADTAVNKNGVAELSLFDAVYQNAKANDGTKILAPGTLGDTIIRLKNDTDTTVKYTAVLYTVKSSDTLPANAQLSGTGFSDTASYSLPKGAEQSHVVRAVTGSVDGRQIQDFDIDWYWLFEESDAQNKIDTWLGDKAANGDPDNIVVGFYIVVEQDGQIVEPDSPQTGDNTMLGGYVALMAISAAVMVLLLIGRRRGRCRDEE